MAPGDAFPAFMPHFLPVHRSNVNSAPICHQQDTRHRRFSSEIHGYPHVLRIPRKPFQMRTERTFIAVKPDGMNRGLLGEVLHRFERKGYKLIGIKIVVPDRGTAERHYDSLRQRPFFFDLVDFICSGPICCMVWEGKNVVKGGRELIGKTDPAESLPGTIRGDFGLDIGRNVVHGSDAVETANREIDIWFEKNELVEWQPTNNKWLYE